VKKLGNGDLLTASDHAGNALVDKLAKEAARADRLPRLRRDEIRKLGEVLTSVATWIGQATLLANHFPDPRQDGSGEQRYLRDSEGLASSTAARARKQPEQRGGVSVCCSKRSEEHPEPAPHSGCTTTDEQWEALRLRVCAKEQARHSHQLSPEAGSCSSLIQLQAERLLSVLLQGGHGLLACPFLRDRGLRRPRP